VAEHLNDAAAPVDALLRLAAVQCRILRPQECLAAAALRWPPGRLG